MTLITHFFFIVNLSIPLTRFNATWDGTLVYNDVSLYCTLSSRRHVTHMIRICHLPLRPDVYVTICDFHIFLTFFINFVNKMTFHTPTPPPPPPPSERRFSVSSVRRDLSIFGIVALLQERHK